MNDKDFERTARAWLEDGPTHIADRAVNAALDEVHLTRQRRARWPAWRSNSMATLIKFAAAAAAIGVLAVVVGIVPRSTGPGTPNLVASPSPSPAASPAASPIPLPDGDLEAGTTYFIDGSWGAGSPRLILTVPAAGWSGSGYDLWKGAISATGNSVTVAMTPWDVANLYVDPCHSRTQGLLDPAVGPTVADLANALVQQAGQPSAVVTDVTPGGHAGKRVELSLPAGLDRATCEQDPAMGGYLRWRAESSWPGGYVFGDVQRNVVYILDLDGQRAVIDTLSMPIASQADLAELEALVASLRFEMPAPSPSPVPGPSAAG